MLDSRERDLNVLKEINLVTKSEKILAEAKKAEIDNTMNHPKTNIIQAYSVNYLRNEWTCFDKEIASHLHIIKKTLHGEINVVSRTLDDSLSIVDDMRDDCPICYYLYIKADKN